MQIFLRHYSDNHSQTISEQQLRMLVSDELENNLNEHSKTTLEKLDPNFMSIRDCLTYLNLSQHIEVWVE